DGSRSLGIAFASENGFDADRCLPTFGLCMALLPRFESLHAALEVLDLLLELLVVTLELAESRVGIHVRVLDHRLRLDEVAIELRFQAIEASIEFLIRRDETFRHGLDLRSQPLGNDIEVPPRLLDLTAQLHGRRL